jgi:hypothetical protein
MKDDDIDLSGAFNDGFDGGNWWSMLWETMKQQDVATPLRRLAQSRGASGE